MNEYRPIVVGRPIAWPRAWSRWVRAYREKSGMLSESVCPEADHPGQGGEEEAPELASPGLAGVEGRGLREHRSKSTGPPCRPTPAEPGRGRSGAGL